jgi:hypothetical protein
LTAEQRSKLPHVPFVYAPHRLHTTNANASRYRETVEYLGLADKLAEMGQLARAGTAFCVHAVHIYGLEYQLAVADIQKAHCDSIRSLHSVPSARDRERRIEDRGDDRQRAHTESKALGDTSERGNDVSATICRRSGGDVEGEVDRMRAQFARQCPSHTTDQIPFRRRDCVRNVDMSARWGAESADWPPSHNLCGRRVSALYLRDLYTSSKPVRMMCRYQQKRKGCMCDRIWRWSDADAIPVPATY